MPLIQVPKETRDLIRTMSRENPFYVDLSFMLSNQTGLESVARWCNARGLHKFLLLKGRVATE